MLYFVLLVLMYNDGTETKKSLYTYNTEDEMLANLHKYYGNYVGGSNVKSVMTAAINSVGGIYGNPLYWEAKEE